MKKILCFIRKFLFGGVCAPDKLVYIPNIENTNFSVKENELLDLINQHRAKLNMSGVIPEKLATDLALEHSDYMIDKNLVSHDFFESRYKKSNSRIMGEICAKGFSTPRAMLYAYLNSPNHKKVIEDSRYTHIGISTKGKYNCCEFTAY